MCTDTQSCHALPQQGLPPSPAKKLPLLRHVLKVVLVLGPSLCSAAVTTPTSTAHHPATRLAFGAAVGRGTVTTGAVATSAAAALSVEAKFHPQQHPLQRAPTPSRVSGGTTITAERRLSPSPRPAPTTTTTTAPVLDPTTDYLALEVREARYDELLSVVDLRLDVFVGDAAGLHPELRQRSLKQIMTRKCKGSKCLVATAASLTGQGQEIVGSVEFSTHEFLEARVSPSSESSPKVYVSEMCG